MPTSPRIYVKACINGARTPDQHPNLPVAPEQLAAGAVAAHGAYLCVLIVAGFALARPAYHRRLHA